ncbi:hypothetical protein [Poseidonibacter ostreae]|jgi:hypothetical protein|uniref:Stringent starvation protein B n=1 Tax=Poseidonibacter ostreae TaxID=2654171 RepID=A0A6L4WRQ0_9BACT|nr:hypothetical protein [Poseidonibacter ostreae]KAB7887517.1 hypothetical protein GA417_02425 [Poseidonibacter ostreae]KAB7888424.1 hypothetical protein GBG19_09305 [Poseidonibacter ostreae]KAB7889119.1 hypothetical protein GBG18_11665 [Poseidonibacter ostreae]MAC84113.1 hypothetical protein [Arcobacter sp.]|tara:strand:- start:2372 stop:2809 length:438 start_codon:yes stop_codon:yes gene_type:complete
MITDIIENEEYKDLVCKQVKETIEFLLDNNQEFSITANIEGMTFNPELPKPIKDQLAKFSLFILSNYTFTTVEINDSFLTFEAGYGSENFGSVAKVPLHCVFQIVVEESILYINSVATVDKFNKNKEQNSMNVFKNNPNNKKFNK